MVPLGKYKGQPVELLAADHQYTEWLSSQPWFRERYATIYQTIINYGQEATASPEHNEMQARFLDDTWCLALACTIRPQWVAALIPAEPAAVPKRLYAQFVEQYPGMNLEGLECKWSPPRCNPGSSSRAVGRRLQDLARDHAHHDEPGAAGVMLPCECAPCDHGECPDYSSCHSGEGRMRYHCRHYYCDPEERQNNPAKGRHCDQDCPWKDANGDLRSLVDHGVHMAAHNALTVRVECKPDLGDDYPAVLRQVCSYQRGEDAVVVVVARRWGFEGVTWEQVTAIFAASRVRLIAEDVIDGQLTK